MVENTPGIVTEREAITFSIQRRFRNNWMMAASYVYSNTEGNCNYVNNGPCEWDTGEYGSLIALTVRNCSRVSSW